MSSKEWEISVMSTREQIASVANVVISYCSSGIIAFIYADTCIDRTIVGLVSSLCQTEVEKGPWECLISGIKISKELPLNIPQGCTYFEFSQGYYIGLLPGYIDVQCVYCQGELRCRYGLQKTACFGSRTETVVSHIDLEYVKELIMKLLKIKGDFIWCITKSGETRFKFFGTCVETNTFGPR
ncbi:MAG: hypothetical protein QW543_01290 [Sulfolobales archaeon]